MINDKTRFIWKRHYLRDLRDLREKETIINCEVITSNWKKHYCSEPCSIHIRKRPGIAGRYGSTECCHVRSWV